MLPGPSMGTVQTLEVSPPWHSTLQGPQLSPLPGKSPQPRRGQSEASAPRPRPRQGLRPLLLAARGQGRQQSPATTPIQPAAQGANVREPRTRTPAFLASTPKHRQGSSARLCRGGAHGCRESTHARLSPGSLPWRDQAGTSPPPPCSFPPGQAAVTPEGEATTGLSTRPQPCR